MTARHTDDILVLSGGSAREQSLVVAAHAGSSPYFAIDPFLGRLKGNGLGFRLRWNALVEWHDDPGVSMGVVSGLPDLDHR